MAVADEASKSRAIITVLGSDRPGIVAAVTAALAHHGANILDISQTILQGTFTMTMLVDLADSKVDFSALQDERSRAQWRQTRGAWKETCPRAP